MKSSSLRTVVTRRGALTFSVGFPDNTVGMADTPLAPAPPQTQRLVPPPSITASTLLGMSESEIVSFLEERLTAVKHQSGLGQHADGTRAIKSLIGVWLISQAGKVVGRQRLVNLAQSDKSLLKSVGGVAKLVRAALNAISVARRAS